MNKIGNGKWVKKKVLVMELLGYFIGTVEAADPFSLDLGKDAVWVRDMGVMSDAMRTGRVNECHQMPGVSIKDHAIRYICLWPHKVPTS